MKPLAKHETGAFQKLPMVMPSIDILSSAQRKARNITPTKGTKLYTCASFQFWELPAYIDVVIISLKHRPESPNLFF